MVIVFHRLFPLPNGLQRWTRTKINFSLTIMLLIFEELSLRISFVIIQNASSSWSQWSLLQYFTKLFWCLTLNAMHYLTNFITLSSKTMSWLNLAIWALSCVHSLCVACFPFVKLSGDMYISLKFEEGNCLFARFDVRWWSRSLRRRLHPLHKTTLFIMILLMSVFAKLMPQETILWINVLGRIIPNTTTFYVVFNNSIVMAVIVIDIDSRTKLKICLLWYCGGALKQPFSPVNKEKWFCWYNPPLYLHCTSGCM